MNSVESSLYMAWLVEQHYPVLHIRSYTELYLVRTFLTRGSHSSELRTSQCLRLHIYSDAASQSYRRGRIYWRSIAGNVDLRRSRKTINVDLSFYSVDWYQISGIRGIRSSSGRDYRYQWSGGHWQCWTRLERLVICGWDEEVQLCGSVTSFDTSQMIKVWC